MALRALALVPVLALAGGAAAAIQADGGPTASAPPSEPVERPEPPAAKRAPAPAIRWRHSLALGSPSSGRLVRGVRLPAHGRAFETWDPVLRRSPNRGWRRWGTDRLVRTVLRAARSYGRAHPSAPPILVGDLSRPRGGHFGPRFGSVGHQTHQNGLDVDIYYPRRDRRPVAARRVAQVDLRLASSLVRHVLRAGARVVLVGPNTGLGRIAPGRVRPFPNHDDHLHARIAAR